MNPEMKKASEELDFAINLHKRMDEVNNALLQDKEVMEELTKQVHTLNREIIPPLKNFVMNMQETRMLVAREIEHILQGARQLKALAASNKDIASFIEIVLQLDKALMNDRLNKLVSYISVAVNTSEKKE
jgi:hypothetical protein